MDHTPSQVLRQLLIDKSLATNGGSTWPVYAAKIGDRPDDCIGVVDTTSVGQGRSQISGEIFEFFGIQINVRAADYQTAWSKAESIKTALSESTHLVQTTVTDPSGYGTATQSYTFFDVSWRSGPLPVHDPSSNRKTFAINVTAEIKQDS
jgi:hypothetical protein